MKNQGSSGCTVTFTYSVDDKVMTPFDKPAIVETCAVGRGGNSYYVSTEAGGAWFPEDQLTAR